MSVETRQPVMNEYEEFIASEKFTNDPDGVVKAGIKMYEMSDTGEYPQYMLDRMRSSEEVSPGLQRYLRIKGLGFALYAMRMAEQKGLTVAMPVRAQVEESLYGYINGRAMFDLALTESDPHNPDAIAPMREIVINEIREREEKFILAK